MSKDHEISIMNNSNLNKKVDYYRFFLLYIKMSATTYCQRYAMLNRARDYYKNDKERLRERAKTKYGELPQEEKNMTREYGRNIFHNMSEEKKQKLKESQKNYVEAKKSHFSDP